MIESGHVPGKGRIRASILKLFPRVPEKGRIDECTEKWLDPGEYREKVESVRVSKNILDECQKRAKSLGIPKNSRIRASIGKR